MATIPTNLNFPTSKQVPDHSIMDAYNKQTYLGNEYISTIGTVSLADTAEHPVMYAVNASPGGGAGYIIVYEYYQ